MFSSSTSSKIYTHQVGLEMNSYGEEEAQTTFEICVVVSRRNVKEEDETCDCVEFLVKELGMWGLSLREFMVKHMSLSRFASFFLFLFLFLFCACLLHF